MLEFKQSVMTIENLMYFLNLFGKFLVKDFWPKLIIFLISLPAIFFNRLYKEAMVALLILIAFDFLTGVIAAKKMGHEIKSAKVIRTAMKTAVYFILISSGHLAETAGLGFLHLSEIILGWLAATELFSIVENFGYMGYETPQKLLNILKEYRNVKTEEKPAFIEAVPQAVKTTETVKETKTETKKEIITEQK